MVILGVVIVLIALLLGGALLLGTSDPAVSGQDVEIQLFDTVTITLNPLTMVLAGMIAMFLLWLGLVLIKTTLTRKAKVRRLRKQQAAEARERQEHEEHLRREEERRTATEREQQVGREEAIDRHPRGGAHDDADLTRPISRDDRVPADATRPIPRDDTPDDATRPIRGDGDVPRR